MHEKNKKKTKKKGKSEHYSKFVDFGKFSIYIYKNMMVYSTTVTVNLK